MLCTFRTGGRVLEKSASSYGVLSGKIPGCGEVTANQPQKCLMQSDRRRKKQLEKVISEVQVAEKELMTAQTVLSHAQSDTRAGIGA